MGLGIDASSGPGRRPTRDAGLGPREEPVENTGLGPGRESDADASSEVGERFSGATGSGIDIKPGSAKLGGAVELYKRFWQ